MVQTVEQPIEYQWAMDALDAIQEDSSTFSTGRVSNVEQQAWKCLRGIVYEVENYRQHEKHHMTWDFSWAHYHERIRYRSCWSSDEDAAWHVSDAGVEFRIILDTLRITQSFNGCHLIEIVGELDGYGGCDFCELKYSDDSYGENGVLTLSELDVRWVRTATGTRWYGVPWSSEARRRDVSTYVRGCLEDYCGWIAGPIQC